MQLRTGKSGAYRYLTCANKANKGALSCQGQSVRMDAVDEVVLSAMEAEVFAPLRLKNLMSQVIGACQRRSKTRPAWRSKTRPPASGTGG